MNLCTVFQAKENNSKSSKIFVYSKCDKATNSAREVQQKVMCDKVETVNGFCYL